jgi:hypothetical protein
MSTCQCILGGNGECLSSWKTEIVAGLSHVGWRLLDNSLTLPILEYSIPPLMAYGRNARSQSSPFVTLAGLLILGTPFFHGPVTVLLSGLLWRYPNGLGEGILKEFPVCLLVFWSDHPKHAFQVWGRCLHVQQWPKCHFNWINYLLCWVTIEKR